jgi:hypothetical protein
MMTDDEVERLRTYLFHAHDEVKDTRFFPQMLERIRTRFHRPIEQPKPSLRKPAKSVEHSAHISLR